MVADNQGRRLVKLIEMGKSLAAEMAKPGMDKMTAAPADRGRHPGGKALKTREHHQR